MKIKIDEKILELEKVASVELKKYFDYADQICEKNSRKVLEAFVENEVSYQNFEEINGYGFYDAGRDKLEKVFAQVLGAEDALVRPQIMSGTNAIYLTLSGLLHYGDTMICISGLPYDPLQEIVGIRGESKNSLMANGIKYEQIDLIDSQFDVEKIKTRLQKSFVKLVEIQRSRGYEHREGLSIKQIAEIAKIIKEISPETIIFVDNCYGELVEELEPVQVGADVMAGSLMHNLGGGIATSGGYVAGKRELVYQIAERLTAPGIAKDLGANYNQLIKYFKGLFFAPQTVCNAVKTAIFASFMFEKLGFKNISPKYNETRSDIIQTVEFGNKQDMIDFACGLQMGSPIDSFATPIPFELNGYPHEEIMGAGNFTQGSTIELTCDGPITPPYTIFLQGALTLHYGKLGVMIALSHLLKK